MILHVKQRTAHMGRWESSGGTAGVVLECSELRAAVPATQLYILTHTHTHTFHDHVNQPNINNGSLFLLGSS